MKYDIFENNDELDIFMNDHKFIIINVSAAWCKPCKAIAKPVEDFIKKKISQAYTVCIYVLEESPYV